jgi:hypothetical protein
MAKRKIERVTRDRPLSREEGEKYRQIREQVLHERPEIESRLRVQFIADPARSVVEELRRTRIERGLSLADISRISGLKTDSLSSLESGKRRLTSVRSLDRYAQALGKRIRLSVEDDPSRSG